MIIPSYRGAGKLPNVLNALVQQNDPAFETVVVADGSVDHSLEVLAPYGKKLNLKVINCPNRGRSGNRNAGAGEAGGELLIFIDDDTRPEPDFVGKHRQHHQQRPGSILVGGVPEDVRIMKTDFQQYKAALTHKWTRPLTGEKPLTEKTLFLTAANFSITASLFRQLGGFDERLTDAEDYDLGVQAFGQAVPIYFAGNAIAWHDDFITCRSYIKRLRQYQAAHHNLRQLKPELYRKFNQYEYRPVGGLKKLVYSLAASQWVVGLIDGGKLRPLPRKLRYKLYDIVTTGLAVHFPNRAL